MLFVRRKFRNLGISRDAVKVIMNGCEPTELNITYCIKFLMSLYKQGYGYSALNSARSALSCIFNDPPDGEHQIICRFMRGVLNERPTKA